MQNKRFETISIHAGQEVDATVRSRAVPIHRTAAYTFRDAAHASALFALQEAGHIYTRISNPTQDILEQRLALLESGGRNGAAALALSSGTSAIFYTIINLAKAGDEIVAASNLYGGTYTMLDNILPQLGICTKFVNPQDINAYQAAITPKTRAIYAETIGNPTLDMVDIKALAELAHKNGLPLVVDSTFTTPYLMRPLELGADIVIHSLTKWIGGHGTAIGGIVVDGNTFDWKNEKFSLYNEPDASYHNIRWGHDLGDMPAFIVRMRTVPLRNLGACLAPDHSWYFLQGLETLALRMERHSQNALAVAKYLQKHAKVAWVRYPLLETDASYPLAKKYLSNGGGGMVVFGLKENEQRDAKKAGQDFIESLDLFSHLANVGDAKSLALHPASTTHSQLSSVQQKQAGLQPELVRLSIGIEHIDDILADLEQALEKI